MSELDPKVQALIDELAKQPGLPPSAIADIKAAIASSPYLEGLTKHAVENGDLQHFGISNKLHMGGHTSAKGGEVTAFVQRDIFSLKDDSGRLDSITETIAHEVRHAMSNKEMTTEWNRFNNDLNNLFVEGRKDPSQPVNVTPPAERMQAADRYNEARASVASFSALASRIEKERGGDLNMEELLTRSNSLCVDRSDQTDLKLAKDLVFNDKNIMQTHGVVDAKTRQYTPHPNVEAAAKCFFNADADKTRLGLMGISDYPNNYGAAMIGLIAERYDHAVTSKSGLEIRLDMKDLGLKADQIEAAGLDLGDRTRFSVLDGSDGMAAASVVTMHKTLTTSRGNTRDVREAPEAPSPRLSSPSPADAEHPDHGTLEQIRAGIRAEDDKIGKPYDDWSERISRSLLAASKDNRDMYPNAPEYSFSANALSRVDHVVMGTTGNVFVVEGSLSDPAMKRAGVNIEQATHTPVEASDRKLEAANQQITQEQAVTRQQELTQAQQQETQRAPSLTR